MVLHLLGKKGWNVYNRDNVERVRRDEAEARAREEAQEQRMQEEDAARRLAVLRGEQPPVAAAELAEPEVEHVPAYQRDTRPHKRRRLRGEDDTDVEIRHARQDVEAGEHARCALAKPGKDHEDAPLLDHAGHLQLIPAPDEKAIRKAEKNAEVEAEKAKKRKREEDQYTMRFSNAAGFNSSVQQKPWYAASSTSQDGGQVQDSSALVLAEVQGKDVWGNEDPRRKEREQRRMSRSDPFAAMQQAQRQLKQSERDKENWQRERVAEMEEVKEAERREKRHRRRHEGRRREQDSLDGFSLDEPAKDEERGDRERRRHKHRHRHRSRSRSRDRRRSSR